MPVDDEVVEEYQGGNGREGWRNFWSERGSQRLEIGRRLQRSRG